MLLKIVLAAGLALTLAACDTASSKQETVSGVQGGNPNVNTQGNGGVSASSCAPGVDCSTAYTQQDNLNPCTTKTSTTPSLNGNWQLSRSYSDGHTEVTTLSISASKLTVSNTCVYGSHSATAKIDDVNILESNGKLEVLDEDSDTKKNVTDQKGTVHTCEAHVAQATFNLSFLQACLAISNGDGKALEFVPGSTSISGNEDLLSYKF